MIQRTRLRTLPGQLFLPVGQSFFRISGYRRVVAGREARERLTSCGRANVCKCPSTLSRKAEVFVVCQALMDRKRRSFQCINRIWATLLLNGSYHIFVALVPWDLS